MNTLILTTTLGVTVVTPTLLMSKLSNKEVKEHVLAICGDGANSNQILDYSKFCVFYPYNILPLIKKE